MHFNVLALTKEAGGKCCLGEDETEPISGRQMQVDVEEDVEPVHVDARGQRLGAALRRHRSARRRPSPAARECDRARGAEQTAGVVGTLRVTPHKALFSALAEAAAQRLHTLAHGASNILDFFSHLNLCCYKAAHS